MKYILAFSFLVLPLLLAGDADAQIFRRRGGGGGGGQCNSGGGGQQGCNIAPIQTARAVDLLQAPMPTQNIMAPPAAEAMPAVTPAEAAKGMDALEYVAQYLLPVRIETQSALVFVSRPTPALRQVPSMPSFRLARTPVGSFLAKN